MSDESSRETCDANTKDEFVEKPRIGLSVCVKHSVQEHVLRFQRWLGKVGSLRVSESEGQGETTEASREAQVKVEVEIQVTASAA